jgi:hypothetical protein
VLSILNRKNIWCYAQNKPTLIAKDFEELGIPRDTTYRILLQRGVFKWLAVRRDLIRLKDKWREEVTETIAQIRICKEKNDRDRLHYLRGYLKALEAHRAQVRRLAHSDRWQAPDFDSGARDFLERMGRNEK